MANVVNTKNGKKFVLLNPAEKAKRYARQISNSNGKMSEKDYQYRAGYLAARRDSADAYNYNEAKKNGTLAKYRANKKARRKSRRNK